MAHYMNRVFIQLGTGIFHCAVSAFGSEWSYGRTEDDGTGIFSTQPGGYSSHTHRETVPMGETRMTKKLFIETIKLLAPHWLGQDYDFVSRNCCHFSAELCRQLGLGPMPGWILNMSTAGVMLKKGYQDKAQFSFVEALSLFRNMVNEDTQQVTC